MMNLKGNLVQSGESHRRLVKGKRGVDVLHEAKGTVSIGEIRQTHERNYHRGARHCR